MSNNQDETAGIKHIFMFEFSKRRLGSIDYGVRFKSSACIINNLTWKIMIIKKKSDDISNDPANDTLGIFLECTGTGVSQMWTCLALVRLTVIAQKPDVKHATLEFKHVYTSLSNARGYPNFIKWDKLPGFIKDDMIRIQAYVEAEPPKNVGAAIIEEDIKPPNMFNDWLFMFENKLNDKIVRRVSEEIKVVNDKIKILGHLPEEIKVVNDKMKSLGNLSEEMKVVNDKMKNLGNLPEEIKVVNDKMKGLGNLSEEIKALSQKVERLDHRNIKIMSGFLKRSLEVVISSFFKKIDSLQLQDKLDNFHTEITSLLTEVRQTKPLKNEDKGIETEDKGIETGDKGIESEDIGIASEDKDNEKPETINNEVDCNRGNEPSSTEPEETEPPREENEESESDCVVIEEKAIEMIDITSSSSESDNDENISNKNAPCDDLEEKTVISAFNFFKKLVLGCGQESSKCGQRSQGCDSRVCGELSKFIAHTCSVVASHHCTAHVHPKCELSSCSSCSYKCCNRVEVVQKGLKRDRENDNSKSSTNDTQPPKKSKPSETDAVEVASNDNRDTEENTSENGKGTAEAASDDETSSCSCTSSSTSQCSSSDDENSQEQPK